MPVRAPGVHSDPFVLGLPTLDHGPGGVLGWQSGATHDLHLPKVMLEHRLPTIMQAVVEWRRSLPREKPGQGNVPWMVYTDGFATHPKDVQLRVTGWSIAWQVENGSRASTVGGCPEPHSTAIAEIAALGQVCKFATRPCVIAVECNGAVKGFRAVHGAMWIPGNLARGPCADLWQALLQALRNSPAISVRWMPAHCTKAELRARGGTDADWTGNHEADKWANVKGRLSPAAGLLEDKLRQLDKEAAAMRIMSEIQRRVLSSGPRLRLAAIAAEGRKRRAPAIPAVLCRAKRLWGRHSTLQ